MTGGYSLTRLTSILAALTASPGAPAKFSKEGLLGEALLALAGMSAVEVGRTHLTGLLIHPHWLCYLANPLPPTSLPSPQSPCLCLLADALVPSFCCSLEQRVREQARQGVQDERIAELALTFYWRVPQSVALL